MPAEPKFKYPRPAKPEIMVVADISGSVAAFARFTLMLVYAIQSQFSKVRSFVFIDGIDEVTDYFEGAEDISEAIHRVNTEADVVWVDGHSDYGHAFEVFWERYGKDDRPEDDRAAARRRPEQLPRLPGVGRQGDAPARPATSTGSTPSRGRYWNTGDSIVGEYAHPQRRRLRVPQPAPARAVRRRRSSKAGACTARCASTSLPAVCHILRGADRSTRSPVTSCWQLEPVVPVPGDVPLGRGLQVPRHAGLVETAEHGGRAASRPAPAP